MEVGQTIDKNNQAIDRLRIHGLLSAAEVEKARTRLIRTIQREVKMASKKQKSNP